MDEQTKQKNLDSIKPIEATSIDVMKYDKKETTIAKATILSMPSKFHDCGKADVLKIESVPLETLEREFDGEKKIIEIRASELFSLTCDDKGEAIGFSTNEGSNLMKFTKDTGIKEPEKYETLKKLVDDLIGKKVLIKAKEKEQEGRTRTFLKFRY